jgi:hypothetical protein
MLLSGSTIDSGPPLKRYFDGMFTMTMQNTGDSAEAAPTDRKFW